jgi:hypothetical protein
VSFTTWFLVWAIVSVLVAVVGQSWVVKQAQAAHPDDLAKRIFVQQQLGGAMHKVVACLSFAALVVLIAAQF